MKRMIFAGLAATLAISMAAGAMAQEKKTLAFVVNGASDFWKIAEAGVRKAQEELPTYTLVFKYPEQSAAAIQQRLMDDLISSGVAGRTARIRLPKFHPEQQWVFNPIIGEGEMGQSFRLVDSSSDAPLGGVPYVLDVQDEYLACGYSDARGNTYYAQSRTRRNINLSTSVLIAPDDTDWCAGPGAAIANGTNAPGTPDLYTQYLGSLIANGNRVGGELRQQIVAKLLSLAISERDTARIAAVLDLGGISDDHLNDVGYRLVDAGVEVERGLAMIDAYLAKQPADAYALDSKGWALYRVGRHDEALMWFDRSIATFAADGDEASAAREAHATALAHKGEVLWKLGRQDEARDAFAQAGKIQPESTELAQTLKRLMIGNGQDDTNAPSMTSD